MEGQPSFEEIAEYIKEHPGSTIQELANAFAKTDDNVIMMPKPGCKKQHYVVAVNVQTNFWEHMQQFTKEPYVEVRTNKFCCMITDNVIYTGPHEFLPLIWSVEA